ncbi:hypothetical protein [Cellulomonas sp. PSBB021]|uniref:hypothetical protein n=1 Tax=Cellulomonas sp. PSBB021 TaxID=2003551 RepID=UPI0018DFCED9|nr:hypothetical protein [Cellulomonas sp. PSBB021]
MIGPSAEQIASAILAGCDLAEQQVRTCVANAPAVIDAALDSVRVGWPVRVPLPEPAKRAIRALIMEAVRECAQVIYDAIDAFRLLARSVGRPTALRAAATRLEQDVMNRATTLDNAMVAANLMADDRTNWDSVGADNYHTAISEQRVAVSSVDDVARGLRDALNSLATDIEEFFSTLQAAYISFAVSAAGLAVAIATAGPTLGVGAIVGLVVAVLGVVTGVWGLVSAFTGASDHNAENAERLNAGAALSWPTSAFA